MILGLAWRNLWRHPRRTVLGAAAVACTSAVLIFLPSMQAGSYLAMIRSSSNILDGYAQIQRQEFLDRPGMRVTFELDSAFAARLRQAAPDLQLAPRVQAFALLVSETRSLGARVIGVDAEREKRFSTLPGRLSAGEYLGAAADQVVLGEGLARNLGVSPGDRITLLGTGADGSLAVDALTVSGLVASGFPALDRQIAQIPIERFAQTFSMAEQRHAWVVFARSESLLEAQLPRLAETLHNFPTQAGGSPIVVRTWRELQPGLLQAIQLDISTAAALYLVLALVVVFSLLNSLLMSVLERTREFGMLLALGVKPNQLGLLVWSESLLMQSLGLLAGILAGAGVTLFYQSRGIRFAGVEEMFAHFGLDPTLYPQLSLLTLSLGPALIGVSLALAGLYPWLRIRRLQIVPAMRGD